MSSSILILFGPYAGTSQQHIDGLGWLHLALEYWMPFPLMLTTKMTATSLSQQQLLPGMPLELAKCSHYHTSLENLRITWFTCCFFPDGIRPACVAPPKPDWTSSSPSIMQWIIVTTFTQSHGAIATKKWNKNNEVKDVVFEEERAGEVSLQARAPYRFIIIREYLIGFPKHKVAKKKRIQRSVHSSGRGRSYNGRCAGPQYCSIFSHFTPSCIASTGPHCATSIYCGVTRKEQFFFSCQYHPAL